MLGTCGIIAARRWSRRPASFHPPPGYGFDWITLTDRSTEHDHRDHWAEDGLRMIKIAHGLDDEGLRANPRCSMVLNVNRR